MKLATMMIMMFALILQAAFAEIQQLSLRAFVENYYIKTNLHDPELPGLIGNYIDKIKVTEEPSIDIELHLLGQLVNYDLALKNDSKYTNMLLDILDDKYKESSNERMKLLQYEMFYYDGMSPDFKKLDLVTKQAVDEHSRMANRYAVAQMKSLVVIGEAYLRLSEGRPGPAQDTARIYFNEAIATRIYDYMPSIKDLKELYLRAAMGLMSMTYRRQELEKLWFAPFTLAELERRFPDKVKYVNQDSANPGRIRIESTVTNWLLAMMDKRSVDDPVLPHLKAVLEFLQAQNKVKNE